MTQSTSWREATSASNIHLRFYPRVSVAMQRLIQAAPPEEKPALIRQVQPSFLEKTADPTETADPLGEDQHCISPYLVHQYKNRALLLTTGRCFSHCRYCFRRSFIAEKNGAIPQTALKTVFEYIARTPSIQEILLSGGDPLTLPQDFLQSLISELKRIRPQLLIRICTRAITFAPEVFTPEFCAFLHDHRPLWIIPHVNHPAELHTEQKKAIERCLATSLSLQSQTVLLKGVNNSVQTLHRLFHELTCLGVKPGYLFYPDRVLGTSHFRIPLDEALALWNELRLELSGLSLPQFALDLPHGGGKFPLSVLARYHEIASPLHEGSFSLKQSDGSTIQYP